MPHAHLSLSMCVFLIITATTRLLLPAATLPPRSVIDRLQRARLLADFHHLRARPLLLHHARGGEKVHGQ
jgi:hypothetical protein